MLLASLLFFLWREPVRFPSRFDGKTGEHCRERRKSVTCTDLRSWPLSWQGMGGPPQRRADLPDGDTRVAATRTAAARPCRPSPPTQVSPGRWRGASDSRPPAPGPNPVHTAHLHQPTWARLRRCKMDTATTPSAPRRPAPAHRPGRPASGLLRRQGAEFGLLFFVVVVVPCIFQEQQKQKHSPTLHSTLPASQDPAIST